MLILNSENYCVLYRHRSLGQPAKQPINNFEPQVPWKCLRGKVCPYLLIKKCKCWVETFLMVHCYLDTAFLLFKMKINYVVMLHFTVTSGPPFNKLATALFKTK